MCIYRSVGIVRSRTKATEFSLVLASWGLVVTATPRPIYIRQGPATHWIGGRAGLNECEKSRPQHD